METNVEFYTALLLDTLGFERETFTCIFAMGRGLGWIAHAREQLLTGRLIRPQSRYTGPSSKIPLDGSQRSAIERVTLIAFFRDFEIGKFTAEELWFHSARK